VQPLQTVNIKELKVMARNGCEGLSTQKQPSCKIGAALQFWSICVASSQLHWESAPNSPEFSLLEFLPLTFRRSHFLAATYISQLWPFCIGLHLFL